ncbi:hypothetical protein [Plantactinospora sp. CA-290183]|uniref:hypothetical protein n=1 Tax=Plantactinospora sp. CA-290183 TaxID=3240006 RepID=UPI003D8E08C9
MSLSLRHRRATVAVAALVAGTPPLVPDVATAEPVAPPSVGTRESHRDIRFGGTGLGGLRCVAAPEETTVSVPAESTVRVVNGTGRRARLMLDGVARAELAAGSSAEVLLHHGPVSLALRPICMFPAGSAVRVEVGPAAQGPDAPGPWTAVAVPGDQPPPPDRPGGAAELTGPVAPVRPSEPIGLLALIATVCVVGVSAGAIRAILAHRATRTVVA